jgi:DNA-binding response OmpR family regulator
MPRRILFIEDDPDISDLISTFLEKMGYTITHYQDPADLFKDIESDPAVCRHADLIITDVLLPGMSGIDMIGNLAERNLIENIPVIFCTAMDNDHLFSQASHVALKTLVFDYLVKPVNVMMLHIKIKNYINLKNNYESMQVAVNEISRLNLELQKLIEDKEMINEYLKERVVKILNVKKTQPDTNLEVLRKMTASIATNDLPLMKFVEMVIETSKNVIYETMVDNTSEADQMFRVLPQAIEPLKTAIVDIELYIRMLLNLKIIDKKDLENNNLKNTSFYEIFQTMYRDGDFSSELFNKLLEYSQYKVDEEQGDVELF